MTTTYFSDNGQLAALSQSGKNIDRTLIVHRDSFGHPISLDFKDSNSSSFSSFWLLSNQQGDIIKILDANWNIVVEYSYDAWGSPIGSLDPSLHPIASLNPFRYRGYVFDDESGLYVTGTRYYNPAYCRFICADATDVLTADLDKLTDKNLFAYCNNSPVMHVDHSGKFGITIGLMAIGGAIGACISAVSSAVTQYVTTGTVNGNSVLVAAGSGFVSGAVAASPLGVVGQMAVGGALGAASYAIDCYVNNDSMTLDGLIASTALGVLAGKIGGSGANSKMCLTKAINQFKKTAVREARRANQAYAAKAVAANSKYLYNMLAYTSWSASARFASGCGIANGVTSFYNSLGIFPNAPS